MPKLTNFTFCDLTDLKNGLPRAINIVPKIEVKSGTFSFEVLFSITDFSANDDHNGYIIFKNPVGEELVRTEPFFLEKNEEIDGNAKVVSGTTIAMEFDDIVFEGSGLYAIQIFFDEIMLGEFYIPVILNSKEG